MPYVPFMRVDNTEIAVHESAGGCDAHRLCVAHRVRATRDRIKRVNYNRHDLNQRFIWEIVYLLLSTNKIFLYTSESNSIVFINTLHPFFPYSYIFFLSSKRFYQSSLLICTILFLVLAAVCNIFLKCLSSERVSHFLINLNEVISTLYSSQIRKKKMRDCVIIHKIHMTLSDVKSHIKTARAVKDVVP